MVLFFLFPLFLLLLLSSTQQLNFSQVYTGGGGYALSFDGVSNFVEVDSPSDCSADPFVDYEFTYELWVFIADWVHPQQIIIHSGGSPGWLMFRKTDLDEINVR